ncbi:MAG TPA: head decoration protein [Afipia sp.]
MRAIRPADFVINEDPRGLSRHDAMFAPAQSIADGQIVAAKIVDGMTLFAALNPAATDGTENAAGISVFRFFTGAGQTVRSPIIARKSTVRAGDLTWPPGITAEQQAAAEKRLRAMGIEIQ